ncbi:hypothetical protein NQ318_017858 [Aromia moschata]|uniref:Sideroflexin 2 n=1 Tax=Aromia moschata TaxID=1265417 RepID=A0AAV8XTV1_9CUCU|nr:hypothetical protein NQ318_017858 [Aromia moschata]
MTERINIDEPLWDQGTFVGRFKHFLWVTDPRTCIVKEEALDNAKVLVEQYRKGQEPPGTTLEQNVFGRMSFQVPGGMAITGAMLQWYRTPFAVVFWQWVNQSFNALVNYTNRNAKSPHLDHPARSRICFCHFFCHDYGVGLQVLLDQKGQPFCSDDAHRYVPFAAVAAANCVNIPLMRQNELLHGIDCTDESGRIVGQSRLAAAKGITQVIISRITMCAPGMLILPVIMERAEKYRFMQRITFLHGPIQVLAVGCFLSFMVPTACGLFPQRCSIKTSTLAWLEPEEFEKIKKNCGEKVPERVYFNKGL